MEDEVSYACAVCDTRWRHFIKDGASPSKPRTEEGAEKEQTGFSFLPVTGYLSRGPMWGPVLSPHSATSAVLLVPDSDGEDSSAASHPAWVPSLRLRLRLARPRPQSRGSNSFRGQGSNAGLLRRLASLTPLYAHLGGMAWRCANTKL